jgi:hypothetical protein
VICSGTALANTISRKKRGEEEITQMKIDTLFFPALLLTWTSLWARIAIQGFELALLSIAIEWLNPIIRTGTRFLPNPLKHRLVGLGLIN